MGYHLTSYINSDIIFIVRGYGGLTQLGACFPYKEKVGGSSPSSSTETHTAIHKMDCKSRKIVGSTPTPPHHLWGGGAAADAREKWV